jgi:hypothetical protein
MNIFERLLLFATLLLTACGTTRNVAQTSYHVTRAGAVGSYKVARAVAVGSYRVASAPVRYVAGSHHNEPVMVGTTDAIPSDVTHPGAPVSTRQSRQSPQTETNQSSSRTNPRVSRSETTNANSKSSSSARSTSAQAEFPTAKAVPDKPGYVFSPFDSSSRYVDVSGYPPGTKVKDPWTDKIFIVP